MTIQQILKKYWGYSDFRPGQIDIIQNIIDQHDTLAILPTGGGKSICFQVPGMFMPGTTLVISPLISLMKDQVDQLTARQIPAIFLESSFSTSQMEAALREILEQKYKFIYVSPERLLSRKFLQIIQNPHFPLNLIAVDEAHCISLWGHDFRPSFLEIKNFTSKLNHRPPIAAFTATTTQACTTDIIKFLNLKNPQIFQKSFARDNLFLNVLSCQHEHDKKFQLLRLLKKHHGQAGIIYTLTRDKTELLARWLNKITPEVGPVGAYHGALEKTHRSQIQDDFIKNKIKIMVATNAFGMGVDKADIDFVIHYQPSSNIENYYQEVGRAGRGGQRGDCYLLNYLPDWEISAQFIAKMPLGPKSAPTLQRQKILFDKLDQIKKYTLLTSHSPIGHHCRQNFILHYFQPQLKIKDLEPCLRCDLCTHRSFNSTPSENKSLRQLQKLRQHICQRLHSQLIPELFLPRQLLQYLILTQPSSINHLQEIPGFGRGIIQNPQVIQPLLNFIKKRYNLHHGIPTRSS